jgi:hypothetical protein
MNQGYGYPQNNVYGNNLNNSQSPNGWNQYNNQSYVQPNPYMQNTGGYNYPPQGYQQLGSIQTITMDGIILSLSMRTVVNVSFRYCPNVGYQQPNMYASQPRTQGPYNQAYNQYNPYR